MQNLEKILNATLQSILESQSTSFPAGLGYLVSSTNYLLNQL